MMLIAALLLLLSGGHVRPRASALGTGVPRASSVPIATPSSARCRTSIALKANVLSDALRFYEAHQPLIQQAGSILVSTAVGGFGVLSMVATKTELAQLANTTELLATKTELLATKTELLEEIRGTKTELLATKTELLAIKTELLEAIRGSETAYVRGAVPVIHDVQLVESCRSESVKVLDTPLYRRKSGSPAKVIIGFDRDSAVHKLVDAGRARVSYCFAARLLSSTEIALTLHTAADQGAIHAWHINPAALALPPQSTFIRIDKAGAAENATWAVQVAS